MKDLLVNAIQKHGGKNIAAPEFTEDLINDILKILKENNVVIHTDEYPKENYLTKVEIAEPRDKNETISIGIESAEKKTFENAINKTPIPVEDNFKDTHERFNSHRIAVKEDIANLKLSNEPSEKLRPAPPGVTEVEEKVKNVEKTKVKNVEKTKVKDVEKTKVKDVDKKEETKDELNVDKKVTENKKIPRKQFGKKPNKIAVPKVKTKPNPLGRFTGKGRKK